MLEVVYYLKYKIIDNFILKKKMSEKLKKGRVLKLPKRIRSKKISEVFRLLLEKSRGYKPLSCYGSPKLEINKNEKIGGYKKESKNLFKDKLKITEEPPMICLIYRGNGKVAEKYQFRSGKKPGWYS